MTPRASALLLLGGTARGAIMVIQRRCHRQAVGAVLAIVFLLCGAGVGGLSGARATARTGASGLASEITAHGGVPYNFGQYDRNFFRWLARSKARVDVLADEDFNGIATGAELRHRYRMVVFESHGEYVTSHMYDITEQYRNLGGHLAFLSANDFFRDVVISASGNSMTLIGAWRDLGRPEASLIGAQYVDWYRRLYPNQPYRVVGARRVPWLFAGTGLRDGSRIPGYYGIEIDGTTSASPPGTTVVATIPDIFPGETADMTYYTTAAGAEVFDAGTINFGGAAANPYVATMLHNLWTHISGTTIRIPARGRTP